MREIDIALSIIIGVELYTLQIITSPGPYSPILSITSLVLIALPTVELRGTARGVAGILEILLGLEITALGFLVPGASVYSIPIGIGLITIMGILSIAYSREGIPRWISLATISMIYVLMLMATGDATDRSIITGMLGAFLAGGFVALTFTREPEEIEV